MAGRSSVGILALQGDVELHAKQLRLLNIEPVFVRLPRQLEGLHGLIIPGGESTALLKLTEATGLFQAIKRFGESGRAVFGTCAGAILLACKVTHPAQPSLGLIDIEIRRNAYGRQVDSFEASGQARPPLKTGPLPMTFIRAPRITSPGKADVLASYKDEPVLVEQENVMAATFHPELTDDQAVYKYWLQKIT